MDHLAIYGWNEDTPRIVRALQQHGALRALAVGDGSSLQLTRARAVTGLPCYQHLHEMARALPPSVALFETAEAAHTAASTVAARGSDLIAHGKSMDGEALLELCTAATRYGVSLALLRPALRRSGLDALAAALRPQFERSPVHLAIDISGGPEAVPLLGDAVAVAMKLVTVSPYQATAWSAGFDLETAVAVSAQLRYEAGHLVTLTATAGDHPRMEIRATSAQGMLRLDWVDGRSRLEKLGRDGSNEAIEAVDEDVLAQEAARTLEVRTQRDHRDLVSAYREAAVLQSIEAALASGQVQPVVDAGVRSTLRVVEGGGHLAPARAGHLQLLSV